MTGLRVLASRIRGLWARRSMDHRMEEELQYHLEMLEQEAIRRGVAPEDARYAARREFGGVDQVREVCRDTRSVPIVEALLQDLRHAVRGIFRTPAFSLMVVAVLAVGTGASST